MVDLASLKAAQVAAFAAWNAAPKARKTELAATLAVAASAVASAKRQMAANTAIVEVANPELVARAELRAAEVAEFRRNAVIENARILYSRAMEWPRCGEDWPKYADEKAAQVVLSNLG